VVAINTAPFTSLEDWKQFWKSKDAADVIWAADADQQLLRLFRVYSLGTTISIDRQGHVSYRDGGATPYDILRAEVKKIL
jgi:hypothetical protein